jgi:hypothetical protein
MILMDTIPALTPKVGERRPSAPKAMRDEAERVPKQRYILRLPIGSMRKKLANGAIQPSPLEMRVNVKGLMVPRLLMKMVPYTLANAWPVSWLKD